jgi:hypothetical protein
MMEQDFPMADAVFSGGPDQDSPEQYQSEIEGPKSDMRQECESIKRHIHSLKQAMLQELRKHTCQFRDVHDITRGRDKSNVSQTQHFSISDTAYRKESWAHRFYPVYSIAEANPFHPLQK